MESQKYNKLVNKTKKKEIQRYREQTSEGEGGAEGQSRSRGENGYYGIIWNHVCEIFENHKALQNLNTLSFN